MTATLCHREAWRSFGVGSVPDIMAAKLHSACQSCMQMLTCTSQPSLLDYQPSLGSQQ